MQQLLSEELTAPTRFHGFIAQNALNAKLHWIIRINKTAVHSPHICKYLFCSNVLRLFYPVILRGKVWTNHHHPLDSPLNRTHFSSSVHANAFRSGAFSQVSGARQKWLPGSTLYLCTRTVMWLNHDKQMRQLPPGRYSGLQMTFPMILGHRVVLWDTWLLSQLCTFLIILVCSWLDRCSDRHIHSEDESEMNAHWGLEGKPLGNCRLETPSRNCEDNIKTCSMVVCWKDRRQMETVHVRLHCQVLAFNFT
jgi:hypothetical protein